MELKVELPAEVVDALGPEREVIEGVLLLLVSEGKISVARAGEILGFRGRISAIRWYTGHGLSYPELSDEDVAGISSWLQILRAVRLAISVCRGTLVRLPVLVFW